MYDGRLNHTNQVRSGSKRVAGVALVAIVALQSGASAQGLAFSLFERYLEPLRIQAGIPGLSAVIVQDGRIAWERGFGMSDLEASIPAHPSTPYPVADLTQTLTATLVLQCVERGEFQLGDAMTTWTPRAADATVGEVLAHAAPRPARGFRYDSSRFALLAAPVERCGEQAFRKLLAQELLDRLVMSDAVPGRDIHSAAPEIRQLFDGAVLDRYAATLARMAAPYKVDRRGRATRGDLPHGGLDGSQGLIASARDLAEFDIRLDGLLLRPETLEAAWINSTAGGVALPTGLGWFVQNYEGQRLVWHFGSAPDAFSSLVLKVPARRLTLILLANSDGLSEPFGLSDGDVTSSLFARTFLRLLL